MVSIDEGFKRNSTREVISVNVCIIIEDVNTFHGHREQLVAIPKASENWQTAHFTKHNSRIQQGFNIHILFRSRGACTIYVITDKLRTK